MAKGTGLTEAEAKFLDRFVERGWLHATREDAIEASAVKKGLRLKYLRKELSEVQFTPAGRAALAERGGAE